LFMLLYIAGSSCAGKTTTLPALRDLPALAVRDFDEMGVPSGADTAWRQLTMERWVQFAVEQQAVSVDVVVAGQSPLGEVLAVPSAPQLEAVAVCLLDVEDEVRRSRLQGRDGDRWDEDAVEAFVGWGRWHREHARDPQSRPEVITTNAWPAMRWDRWRTWRSGDARWSVPVLDTTHSSSEVTGGRVREWVIGCRQAAAAGVLALSSGWDLR
jgi:hypothetical protein